MLTVRNLPERKGQNWMRAATHCVHGHEFTPENTRWNEEGWRACRACSRERKKRLRMNRQRAA